MRLNTKKILTWVYTEESENKFFDMKLIRRGCQELSDSGWRSTIFLLENKGYIKTVRKEGRVWLALTNKGKRMIEAEIEVLNPQWRKWSGEWVGLIIEEKGKLKNQWQKIIKDLYGFEWQTGFYLIPDFQSVIVSEKLIKQSLDNVWLFKIGDWIAGDWREKIDAEFNFIYYNTFYSGISRELFDLLKKKKSKKGLIDSDFIKISNIFDRLFFTGLREKGVNTLLTWKGGESGERVSEFVRLLSLVQKLISD